MPPSLPVYRGEVWLFQGSVSSEAVRTCLDQSDSNLLLALLVYVGPLLSFVLSLAVLLLHRLPRDCLLFIWLFLVLVGEVVLLCVLFLLPHLVRL